MKRKGFTLIELLAVIVILAIIALIAVPVIMNIISSARKSAFEDTAYGLISAGEMYYANALLNDGMTEDAEFTFNNGEFVGENKLEVKGSLPENGKVKVTKDGKVIVAVNNGSMCAKKRVDDTKVKLEETLEYCTLEPTLKELAKTNDFATSVDACATAGTTCSTGTPFAIEVALGDIKNFYVVSDVNNTVTLIMDRNIGDMVAWGTSQASGPITALNYLESQTAGWTNIVAKNYTLADDNVIKGYNDIVTTNVRARMITKSEALGLKKNTWLYSNLIPGTPPYGYWTSTAYVDYIDDAYAWTVDPNMDVDLSGCSIGTSDCYGVRPVIEISKKDN
ncbi:MAG: DUF1566 domain-containing protein [Firmicutes bacterium]|nr:DUF1566 domain-containing protein [Bacillota bacterium]